MESLLCNQCHQLLDKERRADWVRVCSNCGHVNSQNSTKLKKEMSKGYALIMLAVTAIITLVFIQMAHWRQHSISMIPLQIKSVLSVMTSFDHEKKAEICFDLHHYECAAESLKVVAFSDPNNLDKLKKYAKSLVMNKDYELASQVYKQYFNKGGDNLDAAYDYAKVLVKLGMMGIASEYFNMVIDAKPDVFQITVAKNYVKALIENENISGVKRLIKRFKAQGLTSETLQYHLNDLLQQAGVSNI